MFRQVRPAMCAEIFAWLWWHSTRWWCAVHFEDGSAMQHVWQGWLQLMMRLALRSTSCSVPSETGLGRANDSICCSLSVARIACCTSYILLLVGAAAGLCSAMHAQEPGGCMHRVDAACPTWCLMESTWPMLGLGTFLMASSKCW